MAGFCLPCQLVHLLGLCVEPLAILCRLTFRGTSEGCRICVCVGGGVQMNCSRVSFSPPVPPPFTLFQSSSSFEIRSYSVVQPSYSPGWPQIYCLDQAVLRLLIALLPHPDRVRTLQACTPLIVFITSMLGGMPRSHS